MRHYLHFMAEKTGKGKLSDFLRSHRNRGAELGFEPGKSGPGATLLLTLLTSIMDITQALYKEPRISDPALELLTQNQHF